VAGVSVKFLVGFEQSSEKLAPVGVYWMFKSPWMLVKKVTNIFWAGNRKIYLLIFTQTRCTILVILPVTLPVTLPEQFSLFDI
jgi:hypothetical protein